MPTLLGVSVPCISSRALERLRIPQAKERLVAAELWEAHDLVFASTIGTSLEPRNVNQIFYVEQTIALPHWFGCLRTREEASDDIHKAFLSLARAIICFRSSSNDRPVSLGHSRVI
jgi:hypothetical protein